MQTLTPLALPGVHSKPQKQDDSISAAAIRQCADGKDCRGRALRWKSSHTLHMDCSHSHTPRGNLSRLRNWEADQNTEN